MTCNCGKTDKSCPKKFPSAVVEINNPEQIVLLRKVVIPASLGDDTEVPPVVGKYRNVVLQYEANDHIYLYSSDGIPTEVRVPRDILKRIADLELADQIIEQEIEDLRNNPDVVDIVATYADLLEYDTSKLGDKDVIRVLTDETHDDESSYYRWNKPNQEWVFIGAVEGYYTKDQTDALLDGKQDVLTAGDNISIVDDTISAVDTTYTAGTNVQISSQNVISATDTTYSDFTGTDGTAAGVAGLVPAPATTDAGKFLKADGTWGSVQSPINVVQTTGTSTADVMSQNATTSMIYQVPATKSNIQIGNNAYSRNNSISIGGGAGGSTITQNCIYLGGSGHGSATSYGSNQQLEGAIAIGNSVYVEGTRSIGIGTNANPGRVGSIALGAYSSTTNVGEMNIGTSDATYGYNSSNYRLLSGVYDPQSAHDAATKGYVDGKSTSGSGAPTTSTVGTVGQLYQDTTNGKLYICTDATNPYVWEEVGSGGGGGATIFYKNSGLIGWGEDIEGPLFYKDSSYQTPATASEMYAACMAGTTYICSNQSDDLFYTEIVAASNYSTNYTFSLANIEHGLGYDCTISSYISGGTEYYSFYYNEPVSINVVQTTGSSTTNVMSQNAVTTALSGKQGTLTAGTGISINNNVISATSGGLVTLSYGNSTWNDFITAYNAGEIVYCRASSGSDPSVGSQTRMAFMAYVNSATNPTEVEFQYVRSVSTKSASNQSDQVYVYKLTSAGAWTVETRPVMVKIAAGTNAESSYASNTLTINPRLYTTTGQNTDGGVTQKLFTDTVGNIESALNLINNGGGN